MNRHTIVRASLLILLLFSPALAGTDYLCRINPSSINSVLSHYSYYGLTLKAVGGGSADGLYVLTVPNSPAGAFISFLLQWDPQIQSVEPDNSVKFPFQSPASGNPAPKLPDSVKIKGYSLYYGNLTWNAYISQPAYSIIKVNDAHQISGGGGIVADIDSGVDTLHPALIGSFVPGWDFTRNMPGGSETVDLNQDTTPILDQDTTPILDNDSTIVLNQDTTPILDQDTTPILDQRLPVGFGHGTMTAGLIHLVAPQAKIMPLKAFYSDGTSSISLVVAAIYYAVDHGANVINMSFSQGSSSTELKKAIQYAQGKGVITVSSAGNGGQSVDVYPAAYTQTIGVASTNNQDQRSSFSNYGADVTLAAPGEAVITTYPRNHYATGWGTSFSTALVAGAAALIERIDPTLSNEKVMNALSNAAPAGPGLGAGRLDLLKACQSVKSH